MNNSPEIKLAINHYTLVHKQPLNEFIQSIYTIGMDVIFDESVHVYKIHDTNFDKCVWIDCDDDYVYGFVVNNNDYDLTIWVIVTILKLKMIDDSTLMNWMSDDEKQLKYNETDLINLWEKYYRKIKSRDMTYLSVIKTVTGNSQGRLKSILLKHL